MKTKTLMPIVLFMLTSLIVACEDSQKQVLRSQMNDLETERRLLSEDIAGRRSKTASYEQRLYEQQSNLKEYEVKVEAYMMNHKLAVAAILAGFGGATVALDANNEFSDEAESLGAVAAAIAALYAIANTEEVLQVGDYLIQADAHVKNLKNQIKMTQSNLETEKGQLQQEEQKLQSLTTQIAQVRSRL